MNQHHALIENSEQLKAGEADSMMHGRFSISIMQSLIKFWSVKIIIINVESSITAPCLIDRYLQVYVPADPRLTNCNIIVLETIEPLRFVYSRAGPRGTAHVPRPTATGCLSVRDDHMLSVNRRGRDAETRQMVPRSVPAVSH